MAWKVFWWNDLESLLSDKYLINRAQPFSHLQLPRFRLPAYLHTTASFSIYDSLGFAVWLGMKTIAEREQVLIKDNCRNGVSGVWYFGFAG